MAADKEAVYSALYQRISGSLTGVKTVSRRLRHYEGLDPSEQPAVFVHQAGVDSSGEAGRPNRQVVRAEVYVYAWKDDGDGPHEELNGVVHQIEECLERRAQDPLAHAQGATTLGRAVATARLTGIEYGGGTLGAQGVAILSIEMVLPS